MTRALSVVSSLFAGQAASPAFMQPEAFAMQPAFAAMQQPQMALSMVPPPADMFAPPSFVAGGPYSGGPVTMAPPQHAQMRPPDGLAFHAAYGQRY